MYMKKRGGMPNSQAIEPKTNEVVPVKSKSSNGQDELVPPTLKPVSKGFFGTLRGLFGKQSGGSRRRKRRKTRKSRRK